MARRIASSSAISGQRLLGLASTLTALALLARVAHAEGPSNGQRAQELFDEARALIKEEKYAEACPKLEQSQALDPGGGTLLNLGICHVKQGRSATAFFELNRALAQAQADKREDRQHTAEKYLSALTPELSRLTVQLPATADARQLVVELDGSALAPATFGVATPVDPGVHRLLARQTGYAEWSTTLTIAPSRDRQVVVVPALEPASASASPAAPAAPLAPGAPVAGAVAPRPNRVAQPEDHEQRRWLGFASIGVGAVALGAGSYFGLHAYALKHESDQNFDGLHCTEQRCQDAWNDAKSAALYSDVALGIGLAAVGVGTYLVLTSSSSGGSAATVKLSIASTRAGAALTALAQF